MDDPSSGTNLYRLEDHTRVKTFLVPVTKQSRLRQVALLEECKFIVSGSDHGIVYVFDRRSGKIIDELRVDAREWVQTVAAGECSGVSAIFAAKSRDLVGTNEIFVWRKKNKQRFAIVGIACGLLVFLQLFVLMAGMTFMYPNVFATPLSREVLLSALPMYNINRARPTERVYMREFGVCGRTTRHSMSTSSLLDVCCRWVGARRAVERCTPTDRELDPYWSSPAISACARTHPNPPTTLVPGAACAPSVAQSRRRRPRPWSSMHPLRWRPWTSALSNSSSRCSCLRPTSLETDAI
ncbi:hypothetical protein C8F04DRAFT_1193660 [Mycena alexandri]|uniref:Uncharacterized protein n=1 Tax=Mycena alexandri TaxID=1745969 RepID=A0AAD6WQ98_9AGAR|nr:hypothetical protein C8F04DRAFT_1193660 [Mycena alexandri]